MTVKTVEVPPIELIENIELSSTKTAIVVVDMQNDFVHPKGAIFVKGSDKIIANIKRLIESAREKNVRIIYTMDTHTQDDPEFKIWPRHAVENTWGWKIVDELEPRKEDIIIRKIRYDAFFGTPLDHLLRIYGIEYLVLCGVVANICVLHTAGSAALNGYKIVLPVDAIAAITDFDYYVALRQISFLYKGILTTCEGIKFI